MEQQGSPTDSQHPSPTNDDARMMPSVQFIPNPLSNASAAMQVTFIPHVTATTSTTTTASESVQAPTDAVARTMVPQENPIESDGVGYPSITTANSGNLNAPMTTSVFQTPWGDAQNTSTPATTTTTTTAGTTSQSSTTSTSSYNNEDHSRVPPSSTGLSCDEDDSTAHETSGKDPSFSVKLHRMLSSTDSNEYITWLPHGRSWRVLEPQSFETKTIPTYFRHAKVRVPSFLCSDFSDAMALSLSLW
jgi:hypothetical protein